MATKKEINRDKLLKYLSNPDNDFLNRTHLALTVLGYQSEVTIYRHFTPAELTEIENEAMEARKAQTAKQRAEVYTALHKEAKAGNVQAAKEWLDRVEGKVPNKLDGNLNVHQMSHEEWLREMGS